MQVGPAIKEYLDTYGIKHVFIANKLGWSRQKISNTLNGRVPLSVDDYKAICQAIGVPYELFLDD